MKFKALIISGLLCLVCSSSALAAGGNELTDVTPGGATEVTGVVLATEPGDVTYRITIPETINFGTLRKPAADDTTSHINEQTATVTLTEVNNLKPTEAVAVYVKDGTATDTFKIMGSDTVNSGKELEYSVIDQGNKNVLDNKDKMVDEKKYDYLIAFTAVGQETNFTLQLDQNQLVDKDLTKWAGNFKGSINFYSEVGAMGSFTTTDVEN